MNFQSEHIKFMNPDQAFVVYYVSQVTYCVTIDRLCVFKNAFTDVKTLHMAQPVLNILGPKRRTQLYHSVVRSLSKEDNNCGI